MKPAALALLLASACGDAPTAPSPVAPPGADLAQWNHIAEGLARADVGDGIACFRMRVPGYQHPDTIALSCVRVAPMQWGISPGPSVRRAP
jgi:hypothetical protein